MNIAIPIVLCLLLLLSLAANYMFFSKGFGFGPPKPSSTPIQGTSSSPTQTIAASVTTSTTTSTSNVTPTTLSSTPGLVRPGTPFLVDTMTSSNSQDQWDVVNQSFLSCGFSKGGYDLNAPANKGGGCNTEASTTILTNFIYEINMKIVSGITSSNSGAGVTFRYDNQNPPSNYGVSFKQDGTYYMFAFNKGAAGATLGAGHCPGFLQGPNQTNLIDIEVQGSTIKLFMNNTYVMTATDSQFKSGQIGVEMGSGSASAEVVYSDLKVWKL